MTATPMTAPTAPVMQAESLTRHYGVSQGFMKPKAVVKALTLGASSWQVMIRVALPQAMPRLIQALRLSLGPAWVFLISAEAIAAAPLTDIYVIGRRGPERRRETRRRPVQIRCQTRWCGTGRAHPLRGG